MTQPTKTEPTQGEREQLFVDFIAQFAEHCSVSTYDERGAWASCWGDFETQLRERYRYELAAVRDEAANELDGYKRFSLSLEEAIDNVRIVLGLESTHYQVIADQVEDWGKEHHAAGAAEMVERCIPASCRFCRDGNEPYERWVGGLNWSGRHQVWSHDALDGSKTPTVYDCGAKEIRALSPNPNHSDGLEGMKREAVKPLLKIIDDWAEGGHVNGRYLTDEERKVMRQARALLKEGE